MAPKFLTADWRYLAMLNYEVEEATVLPYLPKGTELDDRKGRHFLSLVAFLFLDTHVLGLPALFHQNFEEVNLRFYARRKVGSAWRSGVVFIREMVPLFLVAETAKLTYNEPYRTVPMQHAIVKTNGELQSLEYQFGAGREQCSLAVHADGVPAPIEAGSDEEFLSMRGWGYTRQRDGGTIEYKVDHPRWRIWTAMSHELAGPIETFYDPPFPAILRGNPVSAFIADGSPVAVHMPERIA
jgi:uncharacterized protein YqjF (DUF2071 family)